MKRPVETVQGILRRFLVADRAAAAVEFALILPALLTLYLGSVELSSAISVDKRVATVSGSLGDLVARADSSITVSTVNDYFLAASATMAPYDSSGVKQVVTSVRVNLDGSTTVMWSQPYNGANDHADGSTYDLPSDLKNLVTSNYTSVGYVVVAEAQLSYTPLIGYFFQNAFTLYHEYFFLPRFGEKIDLS